MVIDMWARIESGVVMELTGIDPDGRYHPSIDWLECGDGVFVGWGCDGSIFSEPQPAPPQVPEIVTMRQARLALHSAGLLPEVEASIEALEDPEKTEARIEWDFSTEVRRGAPLVRMLSGALNLTDQEVDDLFILAAAL